MVTIAVLTAMEKELKQLHCLCQDKKEIVENDIHFFEGQIGDKKIVLSMSGMGKVCAATVAMEMIRKYKPDILLNSGCAGALSEKPDIKDIIIGTEFVYHDVWCMEPNAYGQMQGFPATYKIDEHLHKKLLEVFDNNKEICSNRNIHEGLICTGDRFVCSSEDIEFIKSHFPQVVAVDMEATAIAQVCYMHHTNLLSIKVVSDNPIRYPDGFAQYTTFWSDLADYSFEFLKQIIQKL